MRIIFLDIDGVLNSTRKRYVIFFNLLYKLGLKKLAYWWDLYSVRIWYVILLKIICSKTCSDIVLSSSWRLGYSHDSHSPRIKRLRFLFKLFNIEVIGCTPSANCRGQEILNYLSKNRENDSIIDFIIIDDESDRIMRQTGKLIKCDNGLSISNVRDAINKLNERGKL